MPAQPAKRACLFPSPPLQSFYPLNYLISGGAARAAPGPEEGAPLPALRVVSRGASPAAPVPGGQQLERLELELDTGVCPQTCLQRQPAKLAAAGLRLSVGEEAVLQPDKLWHPPLCLAAAAGASKLDTGQEVAAEAGDPGWGCPAGPSCPHTELCRFCCDSSIRWPLPGIALLLQASPAPGA